MTKEELGLFLQRMADVYDSIYPNWLFMRIHYSVPMNATVTMMKDQIQSQVMARAKGLPNANVEGTNTFASLMQNRAKMHPQNLYAIL